MNRTSKEKSYKFWDRVSGWSKAESAANSTLVKCLNRKSPLYIKAGDSLLDFGCGTGTLTLRMAQLAGQVTGVDVSEGMLKRARQNRENHGAENARFTEITALQEMFPDNSFQVVTCFNVLQYIEKRNEIFDHFYRLLQPRGILMVAVPCFAGANALSTWYVKFLRRIRIMPETYFFGVREIEEEISGAGFTLVESINLSNLPERFIVARKGAE